MLSLTMDLETENHIAKLLLEEARRLRLQAEKEGVNVYLRKPNLKARPNSRFLTATVLGVQQANRAVEVNEMWRAREKELELEPKVASRLKDDRYSSRGSDSRLREDKSSAIVCSSSKRQHEDLNIDEDACLRDEEVEEFLHSRSKRGRGAIGSRMDEPGPYLSSASPGQDDQVGVDHDMSRKARCILGPDKPVFLKSKEQEKDGSHAKVKDDDKCESRKRRSKEKKREKEKPRKTRREEKRSDHHHHHHKSRRRE